MSTEAANEDGKGQLKDDEFGGQMARLFNVAAGCSFPSSDGAEAVEKRK